MRHSHVIDVYNSLIKQMAGKIGKKIKIVYPNGSSNVIIPEFEVTPERYTLLVKRRDSLTGGVV